MNFINEMLQYDFMKRAFLVGIFLAIIMPMIGVVMVNRRTSMIGDALSHTSLAGVAVGLIFAVNPLISSMIVVVLAAFLIEFIRKKFPQFGDMATAIIMSSGLGFAAILSKYAPGGSSFESFLFGSVSTISNEDVKMVFLLFIAVVIFSLLLYWALLFISIDPVISKISGVNVSITNFIFTLLSAITVAFSTKTVGALMVGSLLVIPVTTSLVISRSYKETFINSIFFAMIYVTVGISISFKFGFPSGGSIVLTSVFGLIIISFIKFIYKKIKRLN